MALTDCEKTDVRRYCGYRVLGSAEVQLLQWPVYQSRGMLEYRMNNLTASEEAVLRRQLGTLLTLECAVPTAGDNLDTDQAATWSRNPNEQDDRLRLLDTWRHRLCQFLGVSPGRGLTCSNSISIIV
ncbi:MAG: hypothetical protein P4L71_08465 [Acetobacteraceae bacterium]|nr:hypothetical protein [Acetobacteraceae bacterium]